MQRNCSIDYTSVVEMLTRAGHGRRVQVERRGTCGQVQVMKLFPGSWKLLPALASLDRSFRLVSSSPQIAHPLDRLGLDALLELVRIYDK